MHRAPVMLGRTMLMVAVLVAGCDPAPPPEPFDGGTMPPDAGTPVDPGLQCPDTLGASVGQTVDFRGLWTAPNDASRIPAGAVKVALNVVSDRPGLAECRPGQGPLPGTYLTSSERLLSGTLYGDSSFEHTGGVLYRRVPGQAPTKVADVVPASPSGRMRMVVAGDDLYLATDKGVMAVDTSGGLPRTPGAPTPIDLSFLASTPALGSPPVGAEGVFLEDGHAVNYRILFLRQDAEGRLIQGAPTSLATYANRSGDGSVRAVRFSIRMPPDVQVGDRIQVYRSTQVPVDSNPGDTLYQVAEVIVAASNITSGFYLYTDITPDVLLGQVLYTSAVQQGITKANDRPPHAGAMETYKEALFLGDLTYAHRVSFRLLGVPLADTTVYITPYQPEFTYTAPYPSDYTVGQQIDLWGRAFVTWINQSSNTSGIRAIYASGANDPPGMIIMERISPVGGPFYVISTKGSLFSPDLSTPLNSTQERQPHGITISKTGLPYAFPSNSAYHMRLGRADYPILAMMKNRDSLFVFKQDGVWRIYPGPGDQWAQQQMSTDVALQFPDSLAMVDNTVIGFFNRGIMGVSENGLEEYDEPIKNVTDAVRSINLPYARTQPNVFAVADPTRLRYYLWYPEEGGDTVSTHAHVYNARTDTWTERSDAATGGFTGPDGLLFLGRADTAGVTEQRNTGTVQDYQGPNGEALPLQLDWTLYNGNPGGASRFNEVRLLTEKPTTGPYPATFTNDRGYSATAQCRAEGYNSVRLPVPFGCVRTSTLGVSVSRNVLQEYLVVRGLTDVTRGYDGKPGK